MVIWVYTFFKLAAVRRCEEWLTMPMLNPKAVNLIRYIVNEYNL